jgi:ATPase subunit of ABC transporter with duplicated ATPase domains
MKCLATGQLLSVELRDQLRIMLISQTLDNEDDGNTDDLTVEQELHKKPFGMDFRLSEIERYRRLAQQRSGARGKEAREMLLQLEELNLNSQDGEDEAGAAYEEEYERIDHSRVKDVLKKLRISEKMLAKKYTELSGGWKMRIQLAKSLLYDLDLLLLDEPTNHLDIAGVFWLQKVLTSESFQDVTILMVSHNRSFLNEVAQSIVWFKNQRLEYYKGNYDTFLQTIQEKEQFAERYQSALDKKKATLEKSLIQSKKNAAKKGDDKKLKQLASRQTKLEERSGYMRSAKGKR